MSESFRHNPENQHIDRSPSLEFFFASPNGDLTPMTEYWAVDNIDRALLGPFYSLDTAEFVLGCRNNVRESQAARAGRRWEE